MNYERTLQLVCFILSVILIILFLSFLHQTLLTSGKVYPEGLLEVNSAEPILRSYIWIHRTQDLVVQAFLMFAVGLAILLIFKVERW